MLIIAEILYLSNKEDKNKNLEKITVAEVTHSIFYTPWYVAIEKGYFEEVGIDIDLVLTSGADKVSAALLSNDAQIGLAGAESSIYVYNGGEKNYIISFSNLTKRDGQFIVSKKDIKDFKLEDLYGKEVIAGRPGGMPLLNFQDALDKNEIDKNKININTTVDFANLSSTFIATDADFVNLFEPTATILEESGQGFIVASVGELANEVPYTTFQTRIDYFNNNKELLTNFNKALQKGIDFTFKEKPEVVAKTIQDQFPNSSLNEITKIINRYKSSDSWYQTTKINEFAFNNLNDILLKNKLIEKPASYKTLIENINE